MFLFLTTLAGTLALSSSSALAIAGEETFRAAVYEHLITEPSICQQRVCTRSGKENQNLIHGNKLMKV